MRNRFTHSFENSKYLLSRIVDANPPISEYSISNIRKSSVGEAFLILYVGNTNSIVKVSGREKRFSVQACINSE